MFDRLPHNNDEQETAEEARLRIAKEYLKTVEDEVAKAESDDDRETFNRYGCSCVCLCAH
jgi:hypothetical protein